MNKKHFLVIEDQTSQRTVYLESTTCSIGRDRNNQIVINSPRISRYHAILLRITIPGNDEQQFFRIIDGDLKGRRSKNGFKVNGNFCLSYDLQHGDVISFCEDAIATYYATEDPTSAEAEELCFFPEDNETDEDATGFLTDPDDSSCIQSHFHQNQSALTQSMSEEERQASIQRSLERLASFPELFSEPIVEIDLKGNITYLNPAALKRFRDLKKDKLKHPILAGIISLVKVKAQTFLMREVKIGKKIFEQSVHYLAASKLIRIYMVDVTERKQVEEALRESERRFQFAVRGSSDGLWDWPDTKKDKIWYSPRYCELLGYEYGELEKSFSKFKELLHPEDLTSTLTAISTCLEKQTPYDLEYRLQTKSGNYRWFCERGQAFWDEKSQTQRMSGSITDITERKQVEALLKQSYDELELKVEKRTNAWKKANQQLRSEILERQRAEEALQSSMATNRAILNAIPDLIFRVNREGIFVNFKAAKNENLLTPKEKFLGKHISEVFPQEIADPTMNGIERTFATGEVQIVECQLSDNDKVYSYEVRIAVTKVNEVMAIVRDITDRKQAEEDIRRALEQEKKLNELKSRFVTMASHEFRTPLASILSSAELLEHYSHKWSEDKKLNHLQRIQASVNHMTELLNDVLILGKADAGKLQLNPTQINLLQFCQEFIKEIQLTTQTHNIIFQVESCLEVDDSCSQQSGTTENKGSTVYMDEKMLRHILNNLLSNAIKYSPDSDRVIFDLICQSSQAILRIQDFGIGIPPSEEDRLFDSFHRANNVGSIPGTGLGLPIVKRAVDLSGGTITLNSQVGMGTTFTVTLPYLVVET